MIVMIFEGQTLMDCCVRILSIVQRNGDASQLNTGCEPRWCFRNAGGRIRAERGHIPGLIFFFSIGLTDFIFNAEQFECTF